MAADSFRLIIHRGIDKGLFETFTKRAEETTMGVEANEPNTLCFEWYVSDDGADSYLVESYPDSEAFLLHLSRLKETPRQTPEVGPLLEALVFGSPNAQAREALVEMGAKFFPLLIGCTR
jgi:hypothetical protein